MNIKGLDLLFLEVNNLEESIAFYTELLGFELIRHSPESEPPMATLKAGGLKISLAQNLETMLRRGRGVSFFLGVADVDALYDELKRKVDQIQKPVDEGWGGRFITLEDPDKYRLFLVTWGHETIATQ
ncbi:MAG TPA: VOC family protein [Pyrinomonadaceae bacterium]|nr:VOC family protein [Pyrinomonadaceae bacterium]